MIGTYGLLQASLKYYRDLKLDERSSFRFLQVSTDRVFGALGFQDPAYIQDDHRTPITV